MCVRTSVTGRILAAVVMSSSRCRLGCMLCEPIEALCNACVCVLVLRSRVELRREKCRRAACTVCLSVSLLVVVVAAALSLFVLGTDRLFVAADVLSQE